MGAERRGVPLTIDVGQAMKHAAGEAYGLEIIGKQPSTYLFDQCSEHGEIAMYTDEYLSERIQANQQLLKTHGHCTKDKGENIKKKLAQLCEEQDKRHQRSMTGNHENGHGKSKSSAFSEDVKILKGNSGYKLTGEMTCHNQKYKSSNTVPVSSFYSSFGGLSSDSKKQFQNHKSLNEAEKSTVASRVASGKRNRSTSANRKDEKSPLGCSPPVFSRQMKKVTNQESISNRKSNRRKDSLGASLDTAMELSDDEEKSGLEDGKCDFQHAKDLSAHQYALRSNSGREEGFRVTYPSGDPEAVEVRQGDLKHLDAYEFLNDTIIDFYIKYLQRPEFLSEGKKAIFHFFNTFFFKKLLLEKRKKKRGDFYQSKLRKWTKGVNIFEKTYVLVPVHNCAHWSLAIICFSMDYQKKELPTPYILHLDSMKEGHVSEEVFNVLKSYLEAEWNHTKGLDAVTNGVLKNVICKRVEVPLQQNAWDCGLFLLYYIECFLCDARSKFEPHILDSMFGREWFKPQEASNLRSRIKCLLRNLVENVNAEIVMEDMD